jgi:hypothetical protein
MLETCCAAKHDEIVEGMVEDPVWSRALLRRLEAEALTGHELRRVAESDGGLVLDWQLDIQRVSFATARDFVARHHAHCAGPCAWRFGAAVWNGWTLLGVVIVGNPVAPAYANRRILEVNRLCVRRDVAPPLRWNACSMLYGWAAREAARRGFERIITYTREDEDGASLRAAGWTKEARIRGRGWHSTRRRRRNRNAWIDKDRWSRQLAPSQPARHDERAPPQPKPIPSLDAHDELLGNEASPAGCPKGRAVQARRSKTEKREGSGATAS